MRTAHQIALEQRGRLEALLLKVSGLWERTFLLGQIATIDRDLAQGTEARRAETPKSGSVHDGPVLEEDAPNG